MSNKDQSFSSSAAMYMYREGFGDNQIAEAFGCQPHKIANWRRKEGLTATRKRGRPHSFDTGKADALIMADVATSKIAEILGASTNTIGRYRRSKTATAS